MNPKPLFLTVNVCLLLLVTALCPEIAMSQTAAQSAISETAAEYGLGRPRPESPQARQTPAPRSEGWWQAFERGWVYWNPHYGAQLVRGKIFETWGGQRWEQGPLGFPTRGESECRVPDSRDRYQVFEGGRIYWRAATNEGVVFNNPTNFGEAGNCNASGTDSNGEPIRNDGPSHPVNPFHGHFRITFNGFRVNHQTYQALSASWDTVTFHFNVAIVGASGQTRLHNWGYSDDRIGSTPDSRLQGGSASSRGGLQTGDDYPTQTAPWRLTRPPTEINGMPPSTYFEGEITQNTDAIVVIPSIWVVDEHYRLISSSLNLQSTYASHLLSDLTALGRAVAGTIRGPKPLTLNSYLLPGASVGLNDSIRLSFGNPQDRPVGVQREGSQFGFIPQVLVLTYDSAEFMSRTEFSHGLGIGIVPIRYIDDQGFAGDYTLYFQVERCQPSQFSGRC